MLYHYTDFAAFDGIIRCAELRLNNILNMNDASEMRLFMNGICSAVINRLGRDTESEKIRRTEAFFQKKWRKNFITPHMLPAFQDTGMMPPSGRDTAIWVRGMHCFSRSPYPKNGRRRCLPAGSVLPIGYAGASSCRGLLPIDPGCKEIFRKLAKAPGTYE